MSTDIERLVAVFDAKTDQLEQKLDKIIAKNEAAAKKVQEAWTKQPIGAAMASLGEEVSGAVTKLPGLGAALEAIGPAGMAAAVGVGAVLAVMEEVHKAVEFGAAIGEAAEKIGISTDTLQEYRYVVTQTGGSTQEADAAMLKFQQTLGQAALGATRAQRAFKALHLDSQALAKEGLDKALDTTIDALSRVGSEAERQGLAAKLGLDPFIAAIREGPDAIKEMKDAVMEGGGVMSADLIEKSREADNQLKALGQTMKVTLSSTFAQMAPLIITVAEYLALATKAVSDFAVEIGHELMEAWRAGSKMFTQWSQQLADFVRQLEALFPFLKSIDNFVRTSFSKEFSGAGAKPGSADAWINDEGKRLQAFWDGMQKQMDAAAHAAKAGGGQGTLTPGSLGKGAKEDKDDSAKKLSEATAALANALKAELQATLALTTDIDERAAIEVDVARTELKAQIAELEKKKHDAESDKNLRDKATLAKIQGDYTDAEHAMERAETSKEELIARQQEVAHIAQANTQYQAEEKLREQALGAQEKHLTALAQLVTTTEQRNELERQALKVKQQRESEAADAAVASAQAAYDTALAEHNFAAAIKAATDLLAAQNARGDIAGVHKDELRAQAKSQENPFQKFIDDAQDFKQLAMEDGAKAFDALSTGLADAIVNAKSLGEVAKNVFLQMASDLAAALIKKEIMSPIMMMLGLPGMAAGGIAAGGLTLVGERGPELVNLPGGSRVIPNSSISSVGISGSGGAPPTILFDNRGAVIWEQAARTMMAYADRTSATAGFASLQASRQTVPAELARTGGRSFSR